MQDDNSFIIIPNSILKSDVWSKKERFSKMDAYIYLVRESRWQKTSCVIKDVRCGTNQLVCSFKELTKAWNLGNKNEVKRYLDYFENQGWITTKKFKNATLITVVKNSKCNANVTGNVTGDVTGTVTPNTTEKQGVNVGDVTANVTGNVTGNVTQMLPPNDSSRAQVSFDSFNSSSIVNNNIQDNMLKVDSPLLSPQVELEELKKRIAELEAVNASLMKENNKKVSKRKTLDYPDEFEKDFELYGRKGSKKNAFERWQYLSDEDKVKMRIHIPFYLRSNVRQYLKDFEGYINQRMFETPVYCKSVLLYDPLVSEDPDEYHPLADGIFNYWDAENKRLIINHPDVENHDDGYTVENRPEGATIYWNGYSWKWSKEQKTWIKQ